MDVTGIKPIIENTKEIGQIAKEVRDFDPDKRINRLEGKLDKLSDTDMENYYPDKRIETTEYYTSEEERIEQTPSEDSDFGQWEGSRGNSKFIPSEETESGREAKEKLKEKGLDGIEYKNGEPDFSKCAEATVKIDCMTEHRHDYLNESGEKKEGNFTQADKKLAEQWKSEGRIKSDGTSEWNEKDIEKWRHEQRCSWHECCDTKTMHLISQDIHWPGKFIHSGGCLECKIRDNKESRGVFDEE